MTGSDLARFLMTDDAAPLLLALGIVALSFVVEDAAAVAAGILAAQGTIDPAPALLALWTGLLLGDLGLYALGVGAARGATLRRWVGDERLERGRALLDRNTMVAVLLARCIPGLRLPTYAACGFFAAGFAPFAGWVAAATFLWSSALFALVYGFGAAAIGALQSWAWAVGLGSVAVLWGGQRLVARWLCEVRT